MAVVAFPTTSIDGCLRDQQVVGVKAARESGTRRRSKKFMSECVLN